MTEREAFLAGFMAGINQIVAAIDGPRVRRPADITDDQWVHWYGATKRADGTFRAPMSTDHLLPTGKRTRARAA